jgi:hypothetical protein
LKYITLIDKFINVGGGFGRAPIGGISALQLIAICIIYNVYRALAGYLYLLPACQENCQENYK